MLSTKLFVSLMIACLVFVAFAVGQDTPKPKPANPTPAEAEFLALEEAYLAKYKPMYIESSTAWWESSISGDDAAFARRKKADEAIVDLHADKATFEKLKALKDGGQVKDPLLARMLDVMYRTYLPGQADPDLQKKIVGLEADVDQIFNTYRGKIDGKPSTENEIREVLKNTDNNAEAEKAWKAYMGVGEKIDPKLRELVSLRNKMAKQLGYSNYFEMRLDLDEIGVAQLLSLFDELDTLTQKPFAELKGEIDEKMAARFHVAEDKLRPWNYGDLFFQEVPPIEEISLDEMYDGKDLVAVARKYYESIGMPIDDILARSSMYEQEGKSPHAFCTHLDRDGDVRVLCNMQNNTYWSDTLLHELGHAVYDKYISRDLPWLLRDPSHTLTTEGVAMLFGGMTKNPVWLTQVLGVPADQADAYCAAARRTLRAEKLVFCRWTQVMVRFEHGMYTNPDQDLGKLWWDLKKRYQMLNPPENVNRPDYAAKMHIVGAPVYYHGYMMGELFACQVHHHVVKNVLGEDDVWAECYYNNPKAGEFMKTVVFAPGDKWSWNELTKQITGEPLTAKYFAQQYVK